MRRGLVGMIVVVALVFVPAAAATNLLSNPSFEGSVSGWTGWNSTISLASDGTSGSGAAKVTATAQYYSIYTSPRPVATHAAGLTYTAGGYARSANTGQSLCLYIREWNGSSQVGTAHACVTAATGWQQFPAVSYTTKGGSSLEEYVLSDGSSGQSFEIDGMSLDDGAGTTDTTPPDTTITAGPANGSSTTATSASFSFTSTESGTFQCSLDAAAWSACTTPQSYDSLGVGSHTFQVRAIDGAGNVDPTPASDTWSITSPQDTTPPDTTITAGPADGSTTTATSASFSFTSTESGTFQCALDGAAWSTCTSPQSYASLAAGSHSFQVRAIDAAGNVDPTPATRSWTITASPPPPPPSGDPTMLLVGDQHACDSVPGANQAVVDLIHSLDPSGIDPIASLGDDSGDKGTAAEFADCFAPLWSDLKARTHPAIGNHDWGTGNADAYFNYWGAAAGLVNKGWYSYDVGTWHVVVLSSYCGEVGGCGMGSPQVAWLKSDLAAHQTQCTLAYWHHPYFTSSPQPGTSGNTAAFWSVLMQYKADVIVNAHVHLYERFAPQDASGNATPSGIREFVVGTGGGAMVSWSSRAANSEAISNSSFGVLSLTLHSGAYDWKFSPATGSFTDAGSGTCH